VRQKSELFRKEWGPKISSPKIRSLENFFASNLIAAVVQRSHDILHKLRFFFINVCCPKKPKSLV
jgi:hypothetical protein